MGARARAERREANNRTASRQIVLGVLAALFGGTFWGFSGTAASFLFTNYHVETTWLMSMRLLGSGGLFMVYILLFARDGLKKLLRRPRHLLTLAGFALFGMITNQLFYLLAVRMTNPGTATVMQCLQIVIIMVYSCVTSRRMPRRREIIGTGLAFLGTLLIATGGDPTTLIDDRHGPRHVRGGDRHERSGEALAEHARDGRHRMVRPRPAHRRWIVPRLFALHAGRQGDRFSSSEPHRHDRAAFRHGFERHRFGYRVYAYRSNRIRFDHRHGLPYGLMWRFTCGSDELVQLLANLVGKSRA